MNDKRLQIIDAAIKCFAQKGFHATSIQEITDTAGIAKGSLYFYFKSKDELLLSACKHYFDLMVKTVQSILQDESLSPRERLSKQLTLQFEQILKHRDFILMFMNEQHLQPSAEMRQFFFAMRAQTLYINYLLVCDLYGEEGKRYALDGAAMLGAAIGEYSGYVLLDRLDIDFHRLAAFLIARLDNMMEGMRNEKARPILTEENMQLFLSTAKEGVEKVGDAKLAPIRRIRALVPTLPINQDRRDDLLSGLMVLEQEVRKPEPKQVIVKSIIAYLKGFAIPELQQLFEEMETIIYS